MSTSITKFLPLPASSSKVTITIEVGLSQSGMITFNQSGKDIIQQAGHLEYSVADSDTLNNQSFDFNVVCSDVNPSTNKLTVSVTLKGVDNDGPWELSREVSQSGSYQFFGTIEFFK